MSCPANISANGRYFLDEQGQPVFWLGDTQWELFRKYSAGQALELLENRQAKGFNVILVMLTGVDVPRLFPDRNEPYENIEGDGPWLGGDPLRPNEDYFRHIDPIIRLGEQTGQLLVVGIYHQWHRDIITLENARAWVRWVARRYRDVPNLAWCMYPQAADAYRPVCRELAAGLREGDGGAHLISIHPDPSVASSSFMHDENWLKFNMIQTCVDYDQIVPAVTADYQRRPVKPVVMAEGGYEGLEFDRLQTPHHVRKQAYWTALAGGHHVYGHNDAWLYPLEWDRWLEARGAKQLGIYRKVMTSLEGWWDLIPDPTLILSGASQGYSLNLAAHSATGGWIAAYLSESATVRMRFDALKGSGKVQATWIDPRDGSRRQAGAFAASERPEFTSPEGWEDALLVVERVR